MPRFETAIVTELLAERDGLQRVQTDLGRAYVLTELIGPVAVGDRVVVNTTAVELDLGTGGWHVVHWNLARDSWGSSGPGHIMKLRYTSLQLETDAFDPDGTALSIDRECVVCTVHSQVPCVAAAYKHANPSARIAYVMTDGGALPLPISDLVADMRAAGLIDRTITAGHAFGGEIEATNVASALLAADEDDYASLIIVGMGPGVVGLEHPLATTALEVSHVLDTIDYLHGRPILALRYSEADTRKRHQGVSHHSLMALEMTRSVVEVGVPLGLQVDIERHHVTTVDDVDVPALLDGWGLRVTSMGRGPEDDPRFYAVAGAAGTLASLT